MPFLRKTRRELLTETAQDFNAQLPGTDAMLRRSVVGVLSYVHGMALDALYAALNWLSRQIIPTTADLDYLLRWARLFLPVPRLDATFAFGTASVAVTGSPTIDEGTLLRRGDGALFAASTDSTISGGVLTVSIMAQVAGLAGNTAPSTVLSLITPIAGVPSLLTVSSSGLTGGAEIETPASVLARLQRRVQTPPQGGSGNDYINWAFDAHPGVTRAWCYPLENGPGSVTVRFMCDAAYDDGIPLSGDVLIVSNYIESVRPVGGSRTYVAPVADPLDFEISGLAPNTTAIKAAIAASLADLIRKEATPGGNYWQGYTTVSGGTLLLSHIVEGIASVPGVNDFTLVSPSANVTAPLGHIVTLGDFTWS